MIVKTLSKCIREYKKESILTPVYMAGEVFMEVAITYVLSLLIDRGITPGNMGEILRIGGLLILCALVSLAFGVMSGRSAAVASTGFAKNVRQDMYYNIQTFSFANIDKFSTASLIIRLTTDVTRMQHAYMMLIQHSYTEPADAVILPDNVIQDKRPDSHGVPLHRSRAGLGHIYNDVQGAPHIRTGVQDL